MTSILLAYLTRVVIEDPIRYQRSLKNLRPWITILVGVSISVAIMKFATWVSINDRTFAHADPVIDKINERSDSEVDCMNNSENLGSTKCTYSHDASKNLPWIAVWGDSHASAFNPMLREYIKGHPASFTEYSSSGTPPILGARDYFQDNEKTTAETISFNSKVIEDLSRKTAAIGNQKHSAVIIAHWVQYTGMTYISTRHALTFINRQHSHQGSLEVLKLGLENSIRKLQELGFGKILIVLPYPEFKFASIRCYRSGVESCSVPRPDIESGRSEVDTLLSKISGEFTGVRIFDPLPYVCDASACPVIDRGIPTVFDDHHPSVSAAKMLGIKGATELDWLVSE